MIELYINTVIERCVVGLDGGTRQAVVENSIQTRVRLLRVVYVRYLGIIGGGCVSMGLDIRKRNK